MSFSSYFSEQARKPEGLFGRLVMSSVFNIGNARLNRLVYEMMSIRANDRIIEIGFGTGRLIDRMARRLDGGSVVGIDFSKTMVSLAERRNRAHIRNGRVRLIQGDFIDVPLEKGYYDKACSVNTVYFWDRPDLAAKRVAELLKPRGRFVVGFEDAGQLKKRKLEDGVFRLYSVQEIEGLLFEAGFRNGIEAGSRGSGSSVVNCVVALK
ncbi:MAG: class I SAM-dependent methyltransferase [Spirochaetes bacterium]|nr:class I SAM-dependent methyltransferase [Spirochaetota bacterium]